MHFAEKKKVTPRYSRASTMSPTMENGQRDFVNGGLSTLERVAKKKELNSILRNKSVDRSIDTVDATTTATNGPAEPKLSKDNLHKHVRIFAVDNSDSEQPPTDSELGYASDRRPSFGSYGGYRLQDRRLSIDSLDVRRGDSRRGSIASTVAQEDQEVDDDDGDECVERNACNVGEQEAV